MPDEKPEKHKKTKASVSYRVASSEARRCGRCAMFVIGQDLYSRCTDVQGWIRSRDVCDIFAPRRG